MVLDWAPPRLPGCLFVGVSSSPLAKCETTRWGNDLWTKSSREKVKDGFHCNKTLLPNPQSAVPNSQSIARFIRPLDRKEASYNRRLLWGSGLTPSRCHPQEKKSRHLQVAQKQKGVKRLCGNQKSTLDCSMGFTWYASLRCCYFS